MIMGGRVDDPSGCFQKIGGVYPPKWIVYNTGKPYEQMDDLGGKNHPNFWVDTHMDTLPKTNGWMAPTTSMIMGGRVDDPSSLCPRKLQHTPRAHPRPSRSPPMKGIPAYSPLVKVAFRGVFQFGVLKQPLITRWAPTSYK